MGKDEKDSLRAAVDDTQRAVNSLAQYINAAQALENYIVSLIAGPCPQKIRDRQGDVICTGKIRGPNDAILRTGPGVNYPALTSIRVTEEVDVLEVRFADAPSANKENLIWDRVQLSDGRVGWVWQAKVEGCEDLGSFPTYFPNDDNYYNAGSTVLPAPPDNIPPCLEGVKTDEAHFGCAAEVYYRFYYQFLEQNNIPPTLKDLLVTVFYVEFGASDYPLNTTTAALIDNYLTFCGSSGCSGARVIEWLASKQGWYQIGRENSEEVSIPFSQINERTQEKSDLETLPDILNDIEWQPGLGTRVEWGTWPYGSPTYDGILNGTLPTIDCTLWRSAWTDSNGGLHWSDYVDAIVDESGGGFGSVDTYDQNKYPRPPWIKLDEDGAPYVDKSALSTPNVCHVVDNM